MVRRFRFALLFAILASLIPASSAAAEAVFWTGAVYPITVNGQQTNEHVFTFGGVRSVKCKEVSATGTLSGKSAFLTLTPAFASCTSTPSSLPTTVSMNGCDYSVSVGSNESATTGNGNLSISCVSGEIEFKVYSSFGTHAEGKPICTYGIPAQALVAGFVTYHNEGSGTSNDVQLTLNVTLEGKALKSSSKLLCGVAEGEKFKATYTGNTTLKGFLAGAEIGLMVGP